MTPLYYHLLATVFDGSRDSYFILKFHKMSLPYQTIFKFYFLRPTLIDSRKSLDVKSVRKVYIAYLLGSSMHDVMLYINVYIYGYICLYIERLH